MSVAMCPPIFIAFAVGFCSLAGQFIVNRIIFFYVANSEYTAASIIALHLAGFWIGASFARRYHVAIRALLAATFALTLVAEVFAWRLGAIVLGLPATVAASAIFGLGLAALSGALVIRLIQQADPSRGQRVLIADTAGSVAGAIVGGFCLLPMLGIHASFLVLMGVQGAVWLAHELNKQSWTRVTGALSALLLSLGASIGLPVATDLTPRVLSVEGLPVEAKMSATDRILFSRRSPYGLLSVIQSGENRGLNIDGRPLCMTGPVWGNGRAVDPSAWAVGEWPARRVGRAEGARLANIGLGCGMTMAALLATARESAMLEVIEINPIMPKAQRYFDDALPYSQDDPRVRLLIRDGFRHFAEYDGPPYDVVAIDVAWMQNLNATHLFTVEMYRNVRRHLNPEGILGVWIEESSPFSPTSLIIYRTLKEVFPHVVADVSKGAVVFYSSASRADLANGLDQLSAAASDWLAEASVLAPVNRLDNLVMNRTKFAAWGDSTWERLRVKYAFMRETAWGITDNNFSEETDDNITVP
jgi:spermidine synthase